MIFKLVLILAAVGCLAFAAVAKRKGVEAALRGLAGVVRPGAGVLSLALVAAALLFSVKGALFEAGILLSLGLVIGAGARFRRSPASKGRPSASDRPTMDRKRAASLLGVAVDASSPEIRQAHRNLMRKIHPDAGGTAGLAAELNQARDVMLGQTR